MSNESLGEVVVHGGRVEDTQMQNTLTHSPHVRQVPAHVAVGGMIRGCVGRESERDKE